MSDPQLISNPIFQHLIASAVGSGVAECLTLPICTVKTNYQNCDQKRSVRQIIQQLYRDGGIRSFWKASLPAIGGQVVSSSSKYVMYNYISNLKLPYFETIGNRLWWSRMPYSEKIASFILKLDTPYTNYVLNGVISGVLSTLMTHPLDVIKIHWQMRKSILETIKNDGMSVFYRGYSKSVGKTMIASSMFLPIYDWVKSQSYHPVVASAVSSVISTTVMHPMDYWKTRQIYGLSFWQGWNPRPYFKGLPLNLARVIPHFMIMMNIIEQVKKCF